MDNDVYDFAHQFFLQIVRLKFEYLVMEFHFLQNETQYLRKLIK